MPGPGQRRRLGKAFKPTPRHKAIDKAQKPKSKPKKKTKK